MLSALRPSRPMSPRAASTMRSRESGGWGSRALLICTTYCTLYSRREGTGVPSRSTARALTWVALAGQVVFIAAWVVAGALEPGYSHIDQAVSELAARTAAHPGIVTAGVVAFGLSFAALGMAMPAALPRRRAGRIAAALFVGAGLAIALTAVFRLDCGPSVEHCRDLWRDGALSWQQDAHVWTAFGAQLLLAATPFAIAAALWPAPSGLAALGSGVVGL